MPEQAQDIESLTPEGFSLVDVWQDKSEALVDELVEFWLDEKALPDRDQARKRAPQVIFILRDQDDRIAAVSTVYRQKNPQLGLDLYYFRCFTAQKHRHLGLARVLIVAAFNHLNQRFAGGEEPEVKGVAVEVESPILVQNLKWLVWPASRFAYIGKTQRGAQVRIRYFDGATF